MILLLSGTSDTAPLAQRLAGGGLRVLVSTATDQRLFVGRHPNITRRSGPLDFAGLKNLIEKETVLAVIDATHPYAAEIRQTARAVAEELGLPYLTFVRPAAIDENEEGVRFVCGHAEAAKEAFSFGRGVLLTTGSNNVDQYASEARRAGLPLYVRVLPRHESLAQCGRAGIPSPNIIAQRGPFGVDENRQHISQCGAGVLVTKDGGRASGVRAKIEATRLENCLLVVLRRPMVREEDAFDDLEKLSQHVIKMFTKSVHGQ